MGSGDKALSLRRQGGLGKSPQRLAILEIYYQKNNAFLVIFQLKFCLKTFETCSLLRFYILNRLNKINTISIA